MAVNLSVITPPGVVGSIRGGNVYLELRRIVAVQVGIVVNQLRGRSSPGPRAGRQKFSKGIRGGDAVVRRTAANFQINRIFNRARHGLRQ